MSYLDQQASEPGPKWVKPLCHLLAAGAIVYGMATFIHSARSEESTAPKPAAVTEDPGYAMSMEQLNSQIDQTSFVVNQNCSGTLINDKEGFILTANHCISDHYVDTEVDQVGDDGEVKKIKKRVMLPGEVTQLDFVEGVQGRSVSYRYDIVARSQGSDLALLKVVRAKLPNTDEAWVACDAPKRGDPVYAVGNPYVVLYATLSTGIISSTERSYGMLNIDDVSWANRDQAFTQFTAAISPGNSGGALLNKRGELIGVVVRGGPGNIGLAVSLADVRKFLKANDVFAKGGRRVCD